jgi:hypothetical protein
MTREQLDGILADNSIKADRIARLLIIVHSALTECGDDLAERFRDTATLVATAQAMAEEVSAATEPGSGGRWSGGAAPGGGNHGGNVVPFRG